MIEATLCGITVTTFKATINNETIMENLQSLTTSSFAGLREMREMLNIKINNHFIFQNRDSVCEKC